MFGLVISGLLTGGCTGAVTDDPEFTELRPGNGGAGGSAEHGGAMSASDASGGRDAGLDRARGTTDGAPDGLGTSGAGGSAGTSGAGGSAGSGGSGGARDAGTDRSGGSGGSGGSTSSGGSGGTRDAGTDRSGGSGGTRDAGTDRSGGSGGSTSSGGSGGSPGTWRRADLTYYTSYPEPGSEECIEYNGCTWAGQFAFLPDKQTESWVMANNIIAIHSKDAASYRLKTLRVRQGTRQIDAKVYDMCSDSDCNGCCTANAKQTGFLIDLEKYTMERFGSSDGIVEWMCLDCP
jgi:hypothetical protein